MKIKNSIYILLACYLGSFLRLFIENNFIISIVGSFFFGFIISKRLSYSSEKILLITFFDINPILIATIPIPNKSLDLSLEMRYFIEYL